jgi:hypothetical protein
MNFELDDHKTTNKIKFINLDNKEADHKYNQYHQDTANFQIKKKINNKEQSG